MLSKKFPIKASQLFLSPSASPLSGVNVKTHRPVPVRPCDLVADKNADKKFQFLNNQTRADYRPMQVNFCAIFVCLHWLPSVCKEYFLPLGKENQVIFSLIIIIKKLHNTKAKSERVSQSCLTSNINFKSNIIECVN